MENELPFQPILTVDKGEQVAGMWITPFVPGVGYFKLLAKKKENGKCEWVHFIQRVDGTKDSFHRGEVETENDLEKVTETINKVLAQIFGENIKLENGEPEIYSLDGEKLGNSTVH